MSETTQTQTTTSLDLASTKHISMDYAEYLSDLDNSHSAGFNKGHDAGMTIVMNTVLDFINTGGANTQVSPDAGPGVKHFIKELKAALNLTETVITEEVVDAAATEAVATEATTATEAVATEVAASEASA